VDGTYEGGHPLFAQGWTVLSSAAYSTKIGQGSSGTGGNIMHFQSIKPSKKAIRKLGKNQHAEHDLSMNHPQSLHS